MKQRYNCNFIYKNCPSFLNINFLLLIFNYYYYYLKQILLFSIFIPPRIHDPIVTKQCTISQQIFLHPSSSNSLIASLRRGGGKKHEEADFEKGMEISRKTTCKYFVSRGEKGSIYRPFLPTAGLWIKSRRCRAHSWSEVESLGEKTHEIGRLLAINRHPPTFPLNKSARHILGYQNSKLEKLFSSHSSPPREFWVRNSREMRRSRRNEVTIFLRASGLCKFEILLKIIKRGNEIILLRVFSFSTLCV